MSLKRLRTYDLESNLSKSFKIKKYFNIKSGFLCFTFDVYKQTMVLLQCLRLFYSTVGYIATKSETSADHPGRISKRNSIIL